MQLRLQLTRAKVQVKEQKIEEKDLGLQIYQNYIDTNKKSKNEIKEDLNDLVHKKVENRQ